MGFYYGPSTPPDDEKPGGFREVLSITWAVFQALALPLGMLFGAIAALLLLFWFFTITPLLGLAGIAAIVLAFVARGVWEAKHPPEIR